jgi:hypothetical protein
VTLPPPVAWPEANRADVRTVSTSSRIYGIRNVYRACVVRDPNIRWR